MWWWWAGEGRGRGTRRRSPRGASGSASGGSPCEGRAGRAGGGGVRSRPPSPLRRKQAGGRVRACPGRTARGGRPSQGRSGPGGCPRGGCSPSRTRTCRRTRRGRTRGAWAAGAGGGCGAGGWVRRPARLRWHSWMAGRVACTASPKRSCGRTRGHGTVPHHTGPSTLDAAERMPRRHPGRSAPCSEGRRRTSTPLPSRAAPPAPRRRGQGGK